MSQEQVIITKLEKIQATLDRMEQRQIAVKEEIIEKQPVTGSFASPKP